MRDDLPAPTPAPYALPGGRAPIVLHEGELELRHNAQVTRADGRVELELIPSPRFRFLMPTAHVGGPVLGEGDLFVPALGGTMSVFATNSPLAGAGTVKGTIESSNVSAPSQFAEVRFLIANLPDLMGDALYENRTLGSGASERSLWAGRITLEAGDWLVNLDERSDHKDVYARLKDYGGFEITHTGSLRRRGGRCFSSTEASNMLDALAGFLGLASGAWAPPLAAVGLDEHGNVMWRDWKMRWTSPWRSGILCAFDRHKHGLNEVFAGYVERWQDLLWNEPLCIATQMYVEANSPVTAETSLVLGQNILELIAWVRFVEELQTHSPADFDNPRLKASERLRELLAWMRVSPAIPAPLVALNQEARQRGWFDGPHVITEMRNSLVHPRRRQRLTTTPVRARIDLQELVLWYVELALLRLINHQGSYANRLGSKTTGVVEDVPWR